MELVPLVPDNTPQISVSPVDSNMPPMDDLTSLFLDSPVSGDILPSLSLGEGANLQYNTVSHLGYSFASTPSHGNYDTYNDMFAYSAGVAPATCNEQYGNLTYSYMDCFPYVLVVYSFSNLYFSGNN